MNSFSHKLNLGHLQGQGRGSLLSLGSVDPGVHSVDLHAHVVAVRTGSGRLGLQITLSHPADPVAEISFTDGGLVNQPDRFPLTCQMRMDPADDLI